MEAGLASLAPRERAQRLERQDPLAFAIYTNQEEERDELAKSGPELKRLPLAQGVSVSTDL